MRTSTARLLLPFAIALAAVATIVGAGPAAGAGSLSAPTALVVSPQGGTWFVLRWTGSSGATGYHEYVNGQLNGTTTDTAYNFQYLACGTTYTLGVAAYSSSATSPTATISATTDKCDGGTADTTPPGAPGGLSASGVTSSAR